MATNLKTENRIGEYSQLDFLMKAFATKQRQAEIVKVIAVNNDKTLDVQPLLSALDSTGKTYKNPVIYHVPYLQLQIGSIGIKAEPVIDDIGLIVICTQDISLLKRVKNYCLSGSKRRSSWEDAIYLMSCFLESPSSYIELKDDKISMQATEISLSADKVTIDAEVQITGSKVTIDAEVQITGSTETTGTLKNNSINVGSTHIHLGVQPGTGVTGIPQ
jgi:hypothetical protein